MQAYELHLYLETKKTYKEKLKAWRALPIYKVDKEAFA